MSQLTQWNPFRSLARIDPARDFDQMFREFGLRPTFPTMELPDIRIDVGESDKAYTVRADIPGARREDIDVEVDGRQVSITARASRKVEKKDEKSLYTERSEGEVFRSFSLPTEVDGSGTVAKYEDGVLALTLPKKTDGNSKRIKVG